ncbi:unnamed protein product [Caretta caretta]
MTTAGPTAAQRPPEEGEDRDAGNTEPTPKILLSKPPWGQPPRANRWRSRRLQGVGRRPPWKHETRRLQSLLPAPPQGSSRGARRRKRSSCRSRELQRSRHQQRPPPGQLPPFPRQLVTSRSASAQPSPAPLGLLAQREKKESGGPRGKEACRDSLGSEARRGAQGSLASRGRPVSLGLQACRGWQLAPKGRRDLRTS